MPGSSRSATVTMTLSDCWLASPLGPSYAVTVTRYSLSRLESAAFSWSGTDAKPSSPRSMVKSPRSVPNSSQSMGPFSGSSTTLNTPTRWVPFSS